jgi:S-formylglutathione hydrolase FrmB
MHTDKHRFFTKFIGLVLALSWSETIYAQQAQPKPALPVNVENYKLNSRLMAREMPYRVILPEGYGKLKGKNIIVKPKSYPVMYLLHGLTGHFDNWTDKTNLAKYAAEFDYIIVTPEGNNGWYSDSETIPNDKYESYIIRELIPEIEKKFRVQAERNHRAVAGLSMGGYGSVKFGVKNPELFALVGSFSGAFGAASLTEKEIGTKGVGAESIFRTYGAADSETRKQNDLFKIIREMPAEKIKTLPFIYIDCGTEDSLVFQSNRDFINLLVEKKVKHEFRQLPGAHNWKFWDAQVQEFLELSEKFIK